MRIYKYPLKIEDEFTIDLPHFEVLHVGIQGSTPTMWCLVDERSKPVTRKFRCYGTGFECRPSSTAYLHIGTVQTPGGYVWHYFRDIND